MTDTAASPEVTLRSDDLCSKWGFNDGDPPDHVVAWCDANGVDWYEVEVIALLRASTR